MSAADDNHVARADASAQPLRRAGEIRRIGPLTLVFSHLIGLLVAVIVAVLALAHGNSRAWPVQIDVGGGHDARFVSALSANTPAVGFHAPETFGNGTTVRWTSAEATLHLPRPSDLAPFVLDLRLLNARPDGQPSPDVQVWSGGQQLAQITVPPGGARTYQMLVPQGNVWSWATPVTLRSTTISTPGDSRALGVAVDGATVAATVAHPLPTVWLVVWAAILGALAYALAWSLGAPPWLALGSSVVLTGLVTLEIQFRPLEILPFVQRIPMLVFLALLGLWVGRGFADDRGASAPKTTPSTFRTALPRSIPGVAVSLLFSVFWWLGPLYELLMTADGARSVTPAPATAWIGALLIVALCAAVAWWTVAKPPVELRWQVILGIFAAAALIHLVSMLQFAFTRSGPDFWILFKGAREWARGGSLYDLDAVRTNHFGHVFKVPPFYGMLFLPWVFNDGERVLFFHRVLNVVLLTATALVWLRMWRIRPLSPLGLGTLALFNFRPFADTLAYGQIDLALLLILVLALWALRNERDLLAGVLIALGTLFKIYPVLLLAFFLPKKQWRAMLGFALGMLMFNGIAVAVMGWDMHRVYLLEVVPNIGGTTAWVENQTISGFLTRFFASPTDAVIFKIRPVALLGTALSGIVGLIGMALAWLPAERRSTTYALQYGFFLLLMVFVVPAAWMHYETLLVLPLAALLIHWRNVRVALPLAFAAALGFALVAHGNQWSFYDGTVMGLLTILGVSYKFYGMVLLALVLGVVVLRQRRLNVLNIEV